MVRTLTCLAAWAALLVLAAGSTPRAGAAPVAGGYIVYGAGSGESDAVELYRIRPDGSGRRRLTSNQRWDGHADVSPNGRRIAIAHARTVTDQDGRMSEHVGVAIVDASGRLEGTPDIGGTERPRWSPDGRLIASQQQCSFSGTGPDGTCISLFVSRPDGSGRRGLGVDSATSDGRDSVWNGTAWSWSPGGRAIAFERPQSGSDSRLVVALVNVVTGVQRIVTTGAEPVFAPREQLIAVVRPAGIVVVRRDGTLVQWASRAPRGRRDVSPSWSPDGRRLAFWRLDVADDLPPVLVVVELRRSLTRTHARRRAHWTHRIVWSPDSRSLLVNDEVGASTWIYRLDLESIAAPVRLGRGFAQDWAPDPR